jgi:hypothetical protein
VHFAPSFISRNHPQPEFRAPHPADPRVFASAPYYCMRCRKQAKGSFAPLPDAPFCECDDYHWVPLDKYEFCPKCETWWMMCGCPLPEDGKI